jgi:hypothetical protein
MQAAGAVTSHDALTYEQKRRLYRDGFVVLRNAVPPELTTAAKTRLAVASTEDQARARSNGVAQLAEAEQMLALLTASGLGDTIEDAMGPFDRPQRCQVATVQPRRPGEHFSACGYRDHDVPHYGAHLHLDGLYAPAVPQEPQHGSPDEIYTRWVEESQAAPSQGRSALALAPGSGVPLFCDEECTLSIGSYTALVGVCLSDQELEGRGQLGLLKGAHHAVQQFFRAQRDAGGVIGPEGFRWPRLDHSVPNGCGTVLLPPPVWNQFVAGGESAKATTRDGRQWPKPTQVLMRVGDAVIALFHVPHCATRNESVDMDRVNVYFKLRAKSREPHRYVVGGGGIGAGWHDRGPKGELLDFAPGTEPWQRTKDSLCNMWDEWLGMAEVVQEMKASAEAPEHRLEGGSVAPKL